MTWCSRGLVCGGCGIGARKLTPMERRKSTESAAFSVSSLRSSSSSIAPIARLMSSRSLACSAGESTMPACRWNHPPAAMMEPTDIPVLPPTSAAFSISSTFNPRPAATAAAVMPDPPAPTTTTSVSSPRTEFLSDTVTPDICAAPRRPCAARLKPPSTVL